MLMQPSHRALRFESLDSRLCFAFGDVDASFGGDGAMDFSYQSIGKSFEFMRGLFEYQGHIRTLAIYGGKKFGISSVDSTGNLQSSFGEGGTLRIHNRLLQSSSNPAYQLPDGKILALEPDSNPSAPYVVELLPDGTPNPEFGDNGIVAIDSPGFFGQITMFSLPSSGFIVIQYAFGNDPNRVTKFTASGQLDASFGQGGAAYIPKLTQIVEPFVDDQNRILLAGSRYYPSQEVNKFTLVRLLPNGSVDTTLGGSEGLPIDPSVFGGWVSALHPNIAQYTSVTLETNETNSPTKVQYLRILGDGTPDVSFGDNGAASIPIPQQFSPGFLTANLLMVDEFGQTYLVLLGRTFATTSNIVVCRVKSDGTLDESYGQNGWFFRTVQGALQLHRGLLLSSGSLILGGEDFTTYNQFLVQITPSGKIDLGFSQDGQATVDLDAETRTIKRLNTIKQPDQEVGILSGWFPDQPSSVGRGVRVTSLGEQLTEFAFEATNDKSTVVSNPQGGWYDIFYNTDVTIGLRIIKRLSDGLVDSNFGASGRINLTPQVAGSLVTFGGTVGRDGSLYVFAASTSSTVEEGKSASFAAKISAAGQLDTSYGQQGFVLFDDPNLRFVSIAANRNGDVYLVTSAISQHGSYGYQVIALDNLGRGKTSFGIGGAVFIETPYTPPVGGIAIDESGRLLIVATFNGKFAIFAINANGQRNIGFGNGGQVILPFQDLRTYSSLRVAVQRGVIAVWGTQSSLRDSSARLVALDYAGKLDKRLSGTGYRDYNLGSDFATNNDIFFADDGSLYASLFRDVEADNIGTVLKLEGTSDVLIHNWKTPLDVNKSKLVTPSDALVIINYLNNRQGNTIPGLYDGINFPDVNDDLQVTPSDALAVIDYLNRRSQT